VVLDSGANVDCSAEELVQFARLGAVYAQDILGRAEPAVGLLSIGEEPEKGNAAVKEAHQLLLREPDSSSSATSRGATSRWRVRPGADRRRRLRRLRRQRAAQVLRGARAPLMGVFARALQAERETLAEAFRELDYSEHGGARSWRQGREHHLARQEPAAGDQERHQGRIRAAESRMSDHIGGRLAAAARETERHARGARPRRQPTAGGRAAGDARRVGARTRRPAAPAGGGARRAAGPVCWTVRPSLPSRPPSREASVASFARHRTRRPRRPS
jgi:glycerol-3-phosphate acyltransferase PlsX